MYHLIKPISSAWSFSGIGGPGGEVKYSVDIQDTVTYVNLIYEGTGRWVGIGFGKTTMSYAYAMIYGSPTEKGSAIMMDYWLTGHDDGDRKQECSGYCVQLISVTTTNTQTIINASLNHADAIGTTYTYQFDPSGATPIPIMVAWGKEKLHYAGEHCNGCWGTATHTYSTVTDLDYKILSKTQLGNSPISLQLQLWKNTSTIDIIMCGPNDRWFGIAWGSHNDGDGLIYDATGSIYDYYLGGQTDATVTSDTTSNFNILSDTFDGTERVIHVSRTFDTGDSLQDVIFDMTLDTVTFLVAESFSTNNYNVDYHGTTHRWTVAIAYDGSNVTIPPTTTTTTTTRVTHFIDPAATIKILPVTEIGYASGVLLGLKLDSITAIMEVELHGPIGKWFGVLFDSHTGGDSFIYTTNYGGTDIAGISPDYHVGSQVANDITCDIEQNWYVTEISQVNGKQKIVGWRNFTTTDIANDYVINFNVNIMTVFIAHAQLDSLQFDNHGANRWKVTIDLASGGSITTTDILTATEPGNNNNNNNNDVDYREFPLTELCDGCGVYVAIKMTKTTELYELELHGPNDVWFGIIFGDDHYAGDAFIYFGDGTDPDYHASGKTTSTVYIDDVQSWNIIESQLIDGTRQIQANRAFDTGDTDHDYPFNIAQSSVTLLIAKGDSLNVWSGHSVLNRWKVSIDLEGGGISEINIESFYILNHGIFMFIGFGILILFGILLYRFKLIFFIRFQSFWIVPIVRSCFILGTILIWIGFIEKIIHNHQYNHKLINNSPHSFIGLILISIWTLMMLIEFILYKINTNIEFKLFNVVSCILIVLLCFIQMIFGLIKANINWIYFYLFVAYFVLYLIIYIILEIYQQQKRIDLQNRKNEQFEINLIALGNMKCDDNNLDNKNISDQNQSDVVIGSDDNNLLQLTPITNVACASISENENDDNNENQNENENKTNEHCNKHTRYEKPKETEYEVDAQNTDQGDYEYYYED